MKLYSKTDYIEYKTNPQSGDYLGKILSECFENFQDSNGIVRTSILDNILSYKLSLSAGDSDYQACSVVLSENFENITYTWIAEQFGYTLISNPRKITTLGTLLGFELDIAHGNLLPEESYTGEYLSCAYESLRRRLIMNSIGWGCTVSKELEDAKKCMEKRMKVFERYFSGNIKFPVFSQPFMNSSWDPDFYGFCYGDGTYGEWNYSWAGFIGREYHDWTREDQIYFSCLYEATDQYLEYHLNMLPTMIRPELLYFADLSLYCGCSGIWAFMNRDISGDEKNSELNKLYTRLTALGKIEGAGMEVYKEMAESLGKHAANYYDLDEIQEIIGYRIYL